MVALSVLIFHTGSSGSAAEKNRKPYYITAEFAKYGNKYKILWLGVVSNMKYVSQNTNQYYVAAFKRKPMILKYTVTWHVSLFPLQPLLRKMIVSLDF